VSTILKALQRLEDEKSANSERSLDEQVVAHRPPPEPQRRGLKIGAAAIVGLAVAGAAFWFWPTREDPDVTTESTPPAEELAAAEESAAAPTERSAAATTKRSAAAAKRKEAAEERRRRRTARQETATRAQQEPSAVEVSPVVEVVRQLDTPPADSQASDVSPNSAAPAGETFAERLARLSNQQNPDLNVARDDGQTKSNPRDVANAASPATQSSERSAPEKPAQSPPRPAAATRKPAPAPPAIVEVAKPAPKSTPAPEPVKVAAVDPKPATSAVSASVPAPIREPNQEVIRRAKVPTFSVEKTIWHPDADRRTALVKLLDSEEVLRLHEGDAIGPLVVKTIDPNRVLFSHDGIEIQFDVGG